MVPAGIPRWWRDASFFCALELGTMTRWVLCGSALLAAAVMADEKVQTELYTVVDGTKVDEKTMQGFRRGARPPAIAATARTRRAWWARRSWRA
jgi:hypothetical protein